MTLFLDCIKTVIERRGFKNDMISKQPHSGQTLTCTNISLKLDCCNFRKIISAEKKIWEKMSDWKVGLFGCFTSLPMMLAGCFATPLIQGEFWSFWWNFDQFWIFLDSFLKFLYCLFALLSSFFHIFKLFSGRFRYFWHSLTFADIFGQLNK